MQQNNNELIASESIQTTDQVPPMGNFTAWYVMLIVVLIVEIIFFSWLTKTYS